MKRPSPIIPGPGQESVWDYPRPPALEPTNRRVVIEWAGRTIADSVAAIRVCETSHPPTWAVPPADTDTSLLRSADVSSQCEWKGLAQYWHLVVGDCRREHAAWSYAAPRAGYEAITDHFFFYPARVDRCTVDGELVIPQEGGFYGGWITADVVGPFKGPPGTLWW
jgi:uncharacterized protein (DUF427 family)